MIPFVCYLHTNIEIVIRMRWEKDCGKVLNHGDRIGPTLLRNLVQDAVQYNCSDDKSSFHLPL